jgi:localization factor PodJL
MKSGVPWSVKGVEPDAREAAKAKARRAGLTLGAWLNQVIRDSGGTEVSEAEINRWAAEAEEAAGLQDLGEIVGRLEVLERRQIEANREIEQALETLAVRIGRTQAPRPAEPDKGTLERLVRIEAESQKRVERLSREIGMLANRYSDIEARQEQGHQEVAEALERLSRKPAPAPAESPLLAKIQAALGTMEVRLESVSRDSRSAATTFEHALRAVMERVVTGEKRQQEQARAFERALEGLTTQIQEAVTREDSGEAEAVQRLETAVSEITAHFETIEKRRERGSRAVEDAIKNLTERLSQSDQRYGEQVQGPLSSLDKTLQRVTQRIEESEARTQGAVSALDKRLQTSEAVTRGTLAKIEGQLEGVETQTQSVLAAIDEKLAEADARAQSLLAEMDDKLAGSEVRGQDTLAAIDNRLTDIADRIDQNDTEQRASRLALMRAIDDTRKRVAVIEEQPVRYAPAPEPVAAEPAPPQQPGFARYMEEAGAEIEPEAEILAHEEPAPPPRTLYEQDEEVEAEHAPVHDAIEEPPPYKTSEPVWALLAAARAAARAEAAQREAETAPRFDGETRIDPEIFRPLRSERPLKKRKSWRGALLLSVLALIVMGASALYLIKISPSDTPGRPSFFRSVIDELGGKLSPAKPQGEAPVHVTQGAPAPALPAPVSVPSRSVAPLPQSKPKPPAAAPSIASTPQAPAIEAPARDTLAMAKPDTGLPGAPSPLAPSAAPPAGDVALSEQAITAMRSAQSDAERQSALQLLTKAAQTGNADAEFTLGRVYETGRGVKADLSAARHWYGEAAGQGHAAAAFNLGMLEAQSGTRDGYGHAARWFDQAARRGLMDAQFNLGMLYAQGLGIGRDPVEAFAWFSAAAAQGDAGAAAERDRIGQSLDDQARARGEALARERMAQGKPEGDRG